MAGRHARPTRAQARAGAYAVSRQPVSERVRSARRRKARRTAKQASTGVAFAAGAVLIGVVAGGGTYALWQDAAQYDAGILVPADGEASLRFAVGDPASATAAFSNLLPGESKTIPVLLENDGDFDLDVTATLTATTGSGYALRLKLDDACTTSGFLASPYFTDPALAISTPTSVGTIDDGATRKLCVQITADSGIVPSSAMTFDVTISGDSGS
ncbi:MAG TPA: hypothetical protein VNR37_10220 [Microbacteriaceae bacterium]|nr:hypothetical protein [Microbacteriaceae bacterium]